MGTRRKAREIIMEVFYRHDLVGEDFKEIMEDIFEREQTSKGVNDYVRRIVKRGALYWDGISKIIEKSALNWPLTRMAIIDRNIMRIAVVEFYFCDDVPPAVSIDEAIELAKKYSTEDSGAFVNGILDNIVHNLDEYKKFLTEQEE